MSYRTVHSTDVLFYRAVRQKNAHFKKRLFDESENCFCLFTAKRTVKRSDITSAAEDLEKFWKKPVYFRTSICKCDVTDSSRGHHSAILMTVIYECTVNINVFISAHRLYITDVFFSCLLKRICESLRLIKLILLYMSYKILLFYSCLELHFCNLCIFSFFSWL